MSQACSVDRGDLGGGGESMRLFLLQPSVGRWRTSTGRPAVPSVKDWVAQDPGTALTAVAVSSVWAGLGFTSTWSPPACRVSHVSSTRPPLSTALVVSAALVDHGADARAEPAVVLIVLTTRAFQTYGEVDLLTDGGPQPQDSTTTITYFVYGQNSPIRNDAGLASGCGGAVVPGVAGAVSDSAPRDRPAGALCEATPLLVLHCSIRDGRVTSTCREAGAACRPVHPARGRGGHRAVPDLHDGGRGLQAE